MTRKQDAKTSRLAATPVSVLDLAYMRQGGTAAEAFDRSLDLAQHAERWGYRRFWLAEHHGIDGVACSATSVLIGHVAAGTKTIRVGSGGVMLPNHAPLAIAEQFGTLETLFPGRIDLGLGRAPGGDPAVARALRRTLYTNGDDFPELLRELQRYLGDPVAGQVMAIPGAGTKVPVWLLGSSGFSAHLAGTMGLPFAFAAHFMPDNLLPALELYRSSFEPSEVLDKPYAMAAIPVMAAETDAQAAFLATSMQQAFLNLIRNKPGPLPAPVEKIEWNPLEQMTVEAKMRAAIVGSRETVERKLEEFLEETQVDELMVVSNAYEQSDRLRSYEIVSQIHREAGQEQVVAA